MVLRAVGQGISGRLDKMGFFEAVSGTVDPIAYIGKLAELDGRTHSMLVKMFGRPGTDTVSGVDTKANAKLESYLGLLQSRGYEIMDVKLSSISRSGLSGDVIAYHVLVLFR